MRSSPGAGRADPSAAEHRREAASERYSFFALILAVLACDRGEAKGSYTVRDSAGVTMVDNPGDVWNSPSSWRLSADPVVRIGAVDGEAPYLLDQVRGVVVLSDGRIVVANGGTSTLRWFTPNGTFLFERGGSGQGPGEFEYLSGLTVARGDTLIVVDSRLGRLAAFASEGDLVSVDRLLGLTSPAGRAFRLADGSYIVGPTGFSSAQLGDRETVGFRRFPTPIVLRVTTDVVESYIADRRRALGEQRATVTADEWSAADRALSEQAKEQFPPTTSGVLRDHRCERWQSLGWRTCHWPAEGAAVGRLRPDGRLDSGIDASCRARADGHCVEPSSRTNAGRARDSLRGRVYSPEIDAFPASSP